MLDGVCLLMWFATTFMCLGQYQNISILALCLFIWYMCEYGNPCQVLSDYSMFVYMRRPEGNPGHHATWTPPLSAGTRLTGQQCFTTQRHLSSNHTHPFWVSRLSDNQKGLEGGDTHFADRSTRLPHPDRSPQSLTPADQHSSLSVTLENVARLPGF